MNESFSLYKRLRSFGFALRGIAVIVESQHNARIHAVATIAVIALGLGLDVSNSSWCWLVLAMVAVWTCEALNTAIERIADAAVPDAHPLIRDAKDAAAAAVLIAALGAAAIGFLVLGPPLWTALLG